VVHDPGGKVRHRLAPGTVSGASYHGEHQEYRHLLWRDWSNDEMMPFDPLQWGGDSGYPFLQVIGMNASTGDITFNDPTLSRVTSFAEKHGFKRFIMTNISAYRMTDSKNLAGVKSLLRTDINIATILRYSVFADRVLLACGSMRGHVLMPLAEELVADLRVFCGDIWSLGEALDGWPRHPLYVTGSTEMRLWPDAKYLFPARFFAPDHPFPNGGYNVGDTLCYRRQHARNIRDVVCELVAEIDGKGHPIRTYEREDLLKIHAKDIEAWVKRTV
jgi:hypothetical protein